ncbi:hypothetical protein MOE82_01995 [Bacillus licheniformis]|uniref:Uncharacterized protein n=2 Tax=Bacillaceae TaxID=186817 RepID=A0AB37GFV9_BACLI|nr:hypothetical protein [Bacillus licheniformis]MDP4080794.1 hypothetical protein [Bacillota bacterium]AMR10604.1 hypothetical protein AB684_10570 [Bacillus licheniformis]MBU8738735.1 hypothetical protein [Bacillus licheniformis]MCA1182037.1 hypothetical protein [Bacillus licheniformis]MCM3433432.1 hypothetical protein [Bacillus licheniformis]
MQLSEIKVLRLFKQEYLMVKLQQEIGSKEQAQDIINNKRAKYEGKTMQGHHSYSASKFPHLSDKGEVIYPATTREHLHRWHGGKLQK